MNFDGALPQEHENHQKRFKILRTSGMESMTDLLAKLMKKIETPYIYLSDTQWRTYKLENFIE